MRLPARTGWYRYHGLWDGLEVLLYERAGIRAQLIRSYRLLNAKVHVRNYSQKIKREYGIEDEEEEDEEEDIPQIKTTEKDTK